MSILAKLVIIYVIVISVITVILTVYDKAAAKAGKWRIPEATLLILGLAGGALAELLIMCIIRHKTKHAKFMVVLPLEVILHIALIVLWFYITR